MEEAMNNPPSETQVNETNNKRKISVSSDNEDFKNAYFKKLSVSSDNEDFKNAYFKIHALYRQLRPHFVELLRTPDFRNCKAAHEIRKGEFFMAVDELILSNFSGILPSKDLRLVLDLYKQMIQETDLSGENVCREQAPDKFQDGKEEAEPLKTENCVEKPTDLKHSVPSSSSERELNDGQVRGSYVLGGSSVGWNFITYRGSKPVYYGLTKESYLRRRMKQC